MQVTVVINGIEYVPLVKEVSESSLVKYYEKSLLENEFKKTKSK